jgi:hypothetical protein
MGHLNKIQMGVDFEPGLWKVIHDPSYLVQRRYEGDGVSNNRDELERGDSFKMRSPKIANSAINVDPKKAT